MDLYVIETERSLMVSAINHFMATKTQPRVKRLLELNKKWRGVHYAHTCLLKEFLSLYGSSFNEMGCQTMHKVVEATVTIIRRETLMQLVNNAKAA